MHVSGTHRIVVAAPAAQAFLFFTPAGEALWVDGWRPRYFDSPDGATREGLVFTTGEGDERTIWLVADFDRARMRSRYVRTTPASRVGTVEIRCEAIDAGSTRVEVTYAMTALDEAGAASLEAYRGEAFAQMIDGWSAAIARNLPRLMAAELR